MDKVQKKFPDKADELARYFANEKVTKDVLREGSDKKDELLRKLSEVIDAKPSQLEIEDFLAATLNYRNMNKTQKQTAMQKWLVEIGKKEGVERVAVLDGETGEVLAIKRGTYNNVKLNGEVGRVLKGAANKSIDLCHNNPFNTPHSLEDILRANEYKSIGKLFVICHDGAGYVLFVPDGKEVDEKTITAEYNKAEFLANIDVLKLVVLGKIRLTDRKKEIAFEAIRNISEKFGWKFEREK